MLRGIFGRKESNTVPEMAETIDAKAFKDALDRYPALIKSLSKPRMQLFISDRFLWGI